MTMLMLVAVLGGLGYYCTTPKDRARLLQNTLTTIRQAKKIAAAKRLESQPFREALRARTPWAIVTPILIALNVLGFVWALQGTGALGNAEVLANLGPRTTNGEWWRLVTAMFVHTAMFQLLINMAALAQVGLILERLVGRPAFTAVYATGGIFASLMTLSSQPTGVNVSASGAVFAVYGLLVATFAWGMFQREVEIEPAAELDLRGAHDDAGEDDLDADADFAAYGHVEVDGRLPEPQEPIVIAEEPIVMIPLMIMKRLAPVAVLFILSNLMNGSLATSADITGLLVGRVAGLVLAKDANRDTSPTPRVAATAAISAIIAVAAAVPLRGIADVKPEMTRVIAVEDKTSREYRDASDQFKKGRMTADALAQMIDGTIVPELQQADARLKALSKVPPEDQPLVDDAKEYVKLRSESWRLRATGLRQSNATTLRKASRTEVESNESWRLRAEAQYRGNMKTLGKAEGAERASLAVLDRIKSAEGL